jgi:hypothetical protein
MADFLGVPDRVPNLGSNNSMAISLVSPKTETEDPKIQSGFLKLKTVRPDT